MRELVLFGAGDLARWARALFEREGVLEPVAFTVHGEYIGEDTLEGLPVVPFEDLADSHPPDRCRLFVATGYRRMNALRAEICELARARGYQLPSLVSAGATVCGEIGDNVLVAPGVAVMPYSTVGAGTIIATGSTVGHDAVVGSCCYLAAQVAVLGRVRVGDRCFLGGGAVIRNGVSVGARSAIGAGALIMKDTLPDSVHSVAGTPPRDRTSSELDDL